MSAALVRKALEVSEESIGPLEKSLKNSGKRKLKSIEKRKKSQLSPAEVLRRNLKILKALEFSSRAKKYGKISTPAKTTPTPPPATDSTSNSTSGDKKASKKKGKKDKKNKASAAGTSTAFTEEDFEQFEREYFVTD